MLGESANIVVKVAICIAVILVVDLAWLGFGVAVGRTRLNPLAERATNMAMGGTILIAAGFALF